MGSIAVTPQVAKLQIRAVFLGPPGAGKGTQAQQLAARAGVLHVSTGDILREQAKAGTTLGKQAKRYMDSGALVPDELIIAIVADRIAKPDAARGWILDGFPRTVPQAEALDRFLGAADAGQQLTHVVYFAVPEPALVQRLSGRWTCPSCGAIWNTTTKPPRVQGICDSDGGRLVQRDDDRPEAVRNRLDVYRNQTAPLLDFYRRRGRLIELDANRSSAAVGEELATVLGVAGSG
jgi:adenylate kinase